MKTKEKFEHWILEEDHPCIMAQTVFSQEHVKTKQYGKLGDPQHTSILLKDLEKYIAEYDFETNDFKSFIAVFPESTIATEDEFELLLWKQLEEIEKIDTVDWDPSVSRDPEDDNFSFSIAGRSFYIVGMHPNSSRKARRSPYPSIAFNLHAQFEKLREMGAYEKVRDKIRERDKELQGTMNPMLEDFGLSSEAKQYSGKATGKDWVCPFHQLEKE
ncbi:guanitoxin biosynthesis heme-dependent pre-guanitoxin N-hydroxylase GntA [uncultured Christiangramia sp.]|uniref:guanitoxin biosynthesis heme-dependent pre-guanitoxin N-hydroxylase GntA n=1 Tax=Christiangramia sp. 3-2217-3z TaxID=3417564 RepID=UPI0034515D2E